MDNVMNSHSCNETNQDMNILMVYGQMELGGIQTLILRMCRYLTDNNCKVTLLLEQAEGDLYSVITDYVRVVIVGPSAWNKNHFHELDGEKFSHIYCFSITSFLLGLRIQHVCIPGARVLTGVYFPREYCWKSAKKSYIQKLMLDIMLKIPEENILFMNKTNATVLGECVGKNFESSQIIPIPIYIEQTKSFRKNINRNNIVSIGRITDFKTYNFHMVDVVKHLNMQGYSFKYNIYGYGDQEQQLREYIKQRKMEDVVQLHGAVSYHDITNVLSSAFLFIGMGTALLEAAAMGVPTLVSIESAKKPSTYGFFHEIPIDDGNLGEMDTKRKIFNIGNKIEWVYKKTDEEYKNIEKETLLQVKKYSIETVMKKYISALLNAKEFKYPITKKMIWLRYSDMWIWRILKRVGIPHPEDGRYMRS